MKVPSQFAAGDTVTWVDSPIVLPDGTNATSGAYNLSYAFRGPVPGAKADIAATSSGSGWSSTLTGLQTAAFSKVSTPVIWYWQAYATAIAGGARQLVGSGQVKVLPNLATFGDTAFDGRTQSEKDLAAVNAEISSRISGGMTLEYMIGSRHLKKEPMTALLELQSRLKAKVRNERAATAIANGLGNPGKLFARFTGRS